MKTISTILLTVGSIGVIMLAGCKKSDPMVINSGSKTSVLTASATTLVLDRTRLTDTSAAVTFTYTAPSYNYKAVVSNSLQIDVAGDNWKNAASSPLGIKGASQGFSTATLNALLLKLKLPAGTASQVNIRVVNALSSDVATYSNTLSLTVTPFNLIGYIYIVGQFNGYSVTAPDSLFSATSNGIYTGVINFTAGNNRFLVLPNKNFNTKYATTASPDVTQDSLSYATEFVTSGGSDLYAPSAGGNYKVTININTNVVSVVPANAYSVIGSVTPNGNFTTDEDMKYINDGSNTWSGVFAFTYGTFPGSFKVRENHDWKYSWGIPKVAGDAGFGVANTLNDTDNNNIPIATSGSYKVTFSIPISTNSIINTNSVPPTLATYTVTPQ